MDASEVLRTTPATREFTDQPVPDELLAQVLEDARFAPSGGNRQGWRVIVVKDHETRRRLRDLYLEGWYEYLALGRAGMVGFAPTNDREEEARAVAEGREQLRASGGGQFAEHLDTVPVLLVVVADLSVMAATDRDLGRYTIVGGGSVYPFSWSVLLSARNHGLGGVATTMLTRHEPAVLELLGVPAGWVVASGIALGYPKKTVTRLRRARVSEFTHFDRWDGPAFPDPA